MVKYDMLFYSLSETRDSHEVETTWEQTDFVFYSWISLFVASVVAKFPVRTD